MEEAFSLSNDIMHLKYNKNQSISPWRKVSLASWRPRGDSSCYCFEDLDMDHVESFCQIYKVSKYSIIIKALSEAMQECKRINSTIRWGKLIPRKEESVFFHVVSPSRDDLSGVVIRKGANKTLTSLDKEFSNKVKSMKKGSDPNASSKRIVSKLPLFIVRPLLRFYSFFAFTLNINLPVFKTPKDAFGSIMLTAVGSIGISQALCPIAPYTRIPMVISMGKVREAPVVINGKLAVKKRVSLGFTFDHRIMDGWHFMEFFECFKRKINGLTQNPAL